MDLGGRSRWRYRIADTPSGLPLGQPARPRTATTALIALVVVAAAVFGALVGGGTGAGSSSHSGTGPTPWRAGASTAHSRAGASTGSSPAGAGSTAATAAATERRDELSGALRALAGARATGLARQNTAADAVGQAAAITTIATAYRAAAAQVAAIQGGRAPLRALLADLANSYRALAVAARAHSSLAYRRLAARIDREEQDLRLQAASL